MSNPDPIIATLLTKRDKISKFPEAAQRSLWGYVFGQSVAPKLAATRAAGGQVENDEVAKERFITSMLGKAQKPSAEPKVEPSFLERLTADTRSAIAGTAGGIRSAGRALKEHDPLTVNSPVRTLVDKNILQPVEQLYTPEVAAYQHHIPVDVNVPLLGHLQGDINPAGVMHQLPAVAAFEAGASMLPAVSAAPGVLTATQNVIRTAITRIPRVAAGSAAMATVSPEGTTPRKFATEVGLFSIFDALTHGFSQAVKLGVKTPAGAAAKAQVAKAATVVGNTVGKVTGKAERANAIAEFNKQFIDAVAVDSADKAERLRAGARANEVLTPQEFAKYSTKVSEAQAAAAAVEQANKNMAAKATKDATKLSVQAQKTAVDIAALDAKKATEEKALLARADKAAQASKDRAFATQLVAYAKRVGSTPREGSTAWNALKSGSSAKDVYNSEKAASLAKAASNTSQEQAQAIVETAPHVAEVVADLQSIAPPVEKKVKKATEFTDIDEVDDRASYVDEPLDAEVAKSEAVVDVGDHKAFVTASENASETGAGKFTPTAAERNVAAKEQEKSLLAKAEEHRVATETTRAALPGGVRTELPKPPKVVKAPKVPAPHAYEAYGVKRVDPTQWTTPQDVVKWKTDAAQVVFDESSKRGKAAVDSLKAGTITKVQLDALIATNTRDFTKAITSIRNVKATDISRKAKDVLRKAAKATEGGRVENEAELNKEGMTSAQRSGTGKAYMPVKPGATEMNEVEILDKIKQLRDIGFGSAERMKKFKEISAAADAEHLSNADKLELLQDAYDEYKKGGS